MKIKKVENKKDMASFIKLPYLLYKNEVCYVPPLWFDEKKAYNKKNNPILKDSTFQLFVLLDNNDNTIGRIIAYIDHNFNDYYDSNTGFFGAFDCIDDMNAGSMLVNAAETWLKERGMAAIRGPIHPVAENWGFVYTGYDSPPMYMSPWNPEYYHVFFTESGYEKVKDLLVYDADVEKGYTIPGRYDDFRRKFIRKYPSIRIRQLDMKHMKKDAKAIWEISNTALAHNWGYVPLALPVMEDMLRKLRLIVDPDAVWIVEDGEKAVGFCLGFPDINVIIKKIRGRMLPFGWIRFLYGIKKLRDYRLFGLAVDPEWQGRALDSLMYINLYEHLSKKKIHLEANYILEDNLYIKNSLEKLGLHHTKTYRIYEKRLL